MSDMVAVLVTTYNPEIEAFDYNLRSYVQQVKLVVICDNSDCPTRQVMLLDLVDSRFNNVVVLSMGGNKGIAAAQNRAVAYAVGAGFEYFIEMDQDSALPLNYVARMLSTYRHLLNQSERVAGIGSLAVRDSDGFVYDGLGNSDDEILLVDKTLSSGFFYSKSSFDLVGGKDESLFIDYVDWEWCWRAKKVGMSVFVDTGVRISHVLGMGHRSILGLNVGLPAPIRHYYQYRNSMRLMARGYVPFVWKVQRIIINLIKVPYYSFFADRGLVRRSYIRKAFKDLILGRSGKLSD